MIGLISCSSQKLEHAAIARRLYSSPLFQKSLAYAERRCMAVYVLSAAHGLVGIDDFVQPYNRRLGTKAERAQWGKRVVSELFQRGIKHHEDLFVLAGEDYTNPLLHALKDVNWSGAMYTPLAGMQVGERLAFLNAELERMPLQLPAPTPSPVEIAAAKWATPRPDGEEHACSFCGKSERKAKRMISSPGAFICDECIWLCVDILDAHTEAA